MVVMGRGFHCPPSTAFSAGLGVPARLFGVPLAGLYPLALRSWSPCQGQICHHTTTPECCRGCQKFPDKIIKMKILIFSLYCWFLASQEGVSWQESCPWSPGLEHLASQEPSELENTNP